MGGRMAGVVVAAIALWGVAGAAPAIAQETALDWRQGMRSGDVLEIRNVTGDVRVTLADGGTAEVVAEIEGRERDFERIRVLVDEERDGYTICAVYDQPQRETCSGRDWERDRDDRGSRMRASVTFEVRLPAGVELVGSTVTGDVIARDVESDVTANTVTGDIDITTTGIARANNVSGDIDVRMLDTRWDDLSFRTVSGDITLRLPADIDVDVEFASLSGDFESDFDVVGDRVRRRLVGSRVDGTIGSGGRSLSMRTVSGDVQLLRGR